MEGARQGHRRLQIIGLGSAGSQPFQGGYYDSSLVFNGEIYNYAELAGFLGIRAESDTAVLFEILRTGRHELLDRLRGMFAFVYWDASVETFTVGRDPFGIKPLYAHVSRSGDLTFASVPAAIATIQQCRPDYESLLGFLAAGYFPTGRSPFEAIEKLPIGKVLTYRREGDGWHRSERWLARQPAASRTLRDALSSSVAAHMVSDVPVGVLMSGGVDSTLIAALASREVENLRTFSLTNPRNAELDESAFARWNAALIGSEHIEVPASPSTLAASAMPIVESSGEPFADAAYLAVSLLCQRVRQDVKVVLAGEGADELFHGYQRYLVERPLYQSGGRHLARVAASAIETAATAMQGKPNRRNRTLNAWRLGPGVEAHLALAGAVWPVVTESVSSDSVPPWAAWAADWDALEGDPWALGMPRYQAFDLRVWLPNVFLEKSDRGSMLNSVEVRVPFLDPEVAGVARRLGPVTSRKRPLRSELRRLLPDVRLPQWKKGLGVDVESVLEASDLGGRAVRQLRDPGSLFHQMGLTGGTAMASAVVADASLRLRLATLDLWEEVWT